MSKLSVEVAYVSCEGENFLHRVSIASGSDAFTAIKASGVLEAFPEIDLKRQNIGLFSKKIELNTPLRAGDRIEVYRPLAIDPMQKRRRRAAD